MNGPEAERAAEIYLVGRGLQLLERNFHCRRGELDLIMLDGEVLVFVEVRSRKAAGLVTALDSIHPGKQQRLIAAARQYQARRHQHAQRCSRFDVLAVDGDDLNWHQNVLQVDG